MSGWREHRLGLEGPLAAPGGSELVVRRETASQTAGPYVHIGLAPDAAGFDIVLRGHRATLFENHVQKTPAEGVPKRPKPPAFASAKRSAESEASIEERA
jgi:hypothetical protein